MKKKIILMLITILLLTTGCSKVDSIKKGKLDSCKDYKLSKLIDSYIDNAKWEEKSGVVVSGKTLINGEKSDVTIEFIDGKKNVEIKSLEINGIEQKSLEIDNFVNLMCDEANIKYKKKDDKSLKEATLRKIGLKFYTEYYYPKFKENVKDFEKIGIKINLETIEMYPKIDDSSKRILEKCDKKQSKIIIKPVEPYGVNDYKAEINLECN